MKLGKRLKQIDAMVTSGYQHIWDCCCDHGLLGGALLARQAAPWIHFVDIVPELMTELESKLQRFFPQQKDSPPATQWQLHCMDTSRLPLQAFSGKHLVIIAGVGGELVADLAEAIFTTHSTSEIDFLLCPVHHEYALREKLIELNFSLITETLIAENQRFYEILLVAAPCHSAFPLQKIDPVGSLIWKSTDTRQSNVAAAYLEKTLEHYKKIQLRSPAKAQHIVQAYSAIEI